MALFKISKGLSKNLMTNVPYAKEGFAYFTSDDGKFYIDIDGDGTNASPAIIGDNRIPLSALSTDWIKATKIEDTETYPILAFKVIDSAINLIELKYGSIGYKDGTLVIPNVETGNKDEVLIENNDEGSALIIDNKGAGTGIKIINTGEDSLVNNQGININNNILLNMNGSASFNGPITVGGTNISKGSPANILGTNKTNTIISNQLTLQQGAVFGGNAQNAGLVTRGICGVSTPTDDGACEKDNLYINYDGDNSYKASRHVILQAGEAGKDYGNHLYQYAAARGDAVHDWSLNNFYVKSDIDNKLDNLLATNDAMVFKGTIGGDAAATIHELPAKHSAGETYRVYDIKGGNNGKYLGNGEVCEIGDLIICIKDGTTHSAGDWTIVQTNIDGAVINTDGSSTDGHIAIFSGDKGRIIKDSGKSLDDLAIANHTHTKLVNDQYAVYFNGTSLGPILASSVNAQRTPLRAPIAPSIELTPINLGELSRPWQNLYLNGDIYFGDSDSYKTLTEKLADKSNVGHKHEIADINKLQIALDGKSNTGHTHQIAANVDTSNSKEGAIIKLEGTGGTNAVTYKATHADKGPSMANDVSSITTTSNANKSLAGEFGKTLTLNIPRITIDKQGHVNAVANDEVPITLPSTPAIGNGKLTIKVGKTPVAVEETFTANQATDKDIPLPVYTITETNTLLSGKSNSGHTHNYAGSSSAGGPATSADKLNTNAGSEKAPVYFKDGIPVVTGLILDRDISGNADTADKWKTPRTFTIGTVGKTVDGSSNVSWTLDELGVAAGSHKQAYTSSECVTYTSDEATMGITPAAVKKAFTIFEPKSHNHDSNYVKKTGDTMTGQLAINKAGYGFRVNNGSTGYIELSRDSGGAQLYGLRDCIKNIWLVQSDGTNVYFHGKADSASRTLGDVNGLQINTNYLKLSGGTMNGSINCSLPATTSTATNTGAMICHGLAGGNNGMYVGNGDADGSILGTKGKANLIFKSQQSIGFVDGCSSTNAGITMTINTRTGVLRGNKLWGAVWNDYAECREADTIEPGKCVIEVGNDTLITSTERLMPGANITSDTFGFAIGETEQAKTPIAVSGRVLAYPYESREEFKKNIGRPVCSGPNGTVSIMTDEEYRNKGYCAIGTISAVPDYEEWGTGKVKVNGRVWIKVF